MKILHVIFSFTTGGAETMLIDIINEQSKTQRVELLIINNNIIEYLINNINKGVIIHYLNRRPRSRNPFIFYKFNYKVFKIKPDVIHFHNEAAINLLIFKHMAFTCLTIHAENLPIDNLFKYKKLFSISKAVKKDILLRSHKKSVVVYNGIKFDNIEFNGFTEKFDNFKILQISRLDHENKGQHILMKAISCLIYKRGITNVQLDLIGEGESLEYLKNLANQLNIVNHINFLGLKTRKYIYKELKNYQLLVQPSIYEGFGLTIVEGIAAKIPVLVSNIDGPLEIIKNGRYGYVFDKGNPHDCTNEIFEIIQEYNTKHMLNKINEAYLYAEREFDIRVTAKEYLKNYLANE
jgi:glycosyltransferase involved in cell wall biosynthesis